MIVRMAADKESRRLTAAQEGAPPGDRVVDRGIATNIAGSEGRARRNSPHDAGEARAAAKVISLAATVANK